MPKGTHIGQLSISMLKDTLPEQFLMRYDYEFLYQLKATVKQIREVATSDKPFFAHSVLEELAIYLFMEESAFLMDSMYNEMKSEGINGLDMRNEWAFEMFGDIDIITFLFSGFFIDDEESYHFDNWSNRQFFIEN